MWRKRLIQRNMPCQLSDLKRVVYFQEMFGTENFL
jgi:hypothetical protein